jgi:hypothetical protein
VPFTQVPINTKVPPGWTNADTELSAANYWGRSDGEGVMLAKEYGFNNPMPVMCSTRESGSCNYMFKAGDYFYIWNEIEDEVWKITYPTTVNDILSAMMMEGSKTWTAELVEIVD